MTRKNRQMYNNTRTFESFMAYGLGSGVNGITVSALPCANATGRGQTLKLCPNAGLLTCSKVSYKVSSLPDNATHVNPQYSRLSVR